MNSTSLTPLEVEEQIDELYDPDSSETTNAKDTQKQERLRLAADAKRAEYYRKKIVSQRQFVLDDGPFSLFFEAVPEEISLAILIGEKRVKAVPNDFLTVASPDQPIKVSDNPDQQAAFLLRENIKIGPSSEETLAEAYAYLAKLIIQQKVTANLIEFGKNEIPKTVPAQAKKLCLQALATKSNCSAALFVLAELLKQNYIDADKDFLPPEMLNKPRNEQADYIYGKVYQIEGSDLDNQGLLPVKEEYTDKPLSPRASPKIFKSVDNSCVEEAITPNFKECNDTEGDEPIHAPVIHY